MVFALLLSGCVEAPAIELPSPILVGRLSCDSAKQSERYDECAPAACECTDTLDFCANEENDGAMCCIDATDFVVVGVCRWGYCDWDTCYAAAEDEPETCESLDAFVGSDGCYQPTAACSPDAPDALDACGGPATLYLCANVPLHLGGGMTDFRSCHVPDVEPVDCAWGSSTPLCCEP